MLKRLQLYLQCALALALVAIREQRPRRKLMFWLTLLALGLLFIGALPLEDQLAANLIIFCAFWGFCVLLVLLLMLLALYDMLSVLRAARRPTMPPSGRNDDSSLR